ncbi:PKD domain-containing protein, partial [Bacteroidales bacterium AH-315-I05]|nr:PKD domain-containing protein [Bacteroidales bacterium AH-315-I05]
MARIIANAVEWGTNSAPDWVNLSSPSSGTVTAGDSTIVNVTFSSNGMGSGIYYTDLEITSNDPANPLVIITCTLTIDSTPCADFTYTTSICSGTVNFTDASTNMSGTPGSCGIATGGCSSTPTSITIGTGTSTNTTTGYPAPYGNWYWGSRHQILFTVSELYAMGFYGGEITELAFDVATVNGTSTYNNFEIKMGCTSSGQLSSWETGLVSVFLAQTITVTTGWNAHTFSNAFAWDGVSNVVVEVCFNNSSYTNNCSSYYTTTSFNSVLYYRADNSTVCSAVSSPTVSSNRPNVRLTKCDASSPSLSWSWDFGNGDTSSVQNPSTTYSSSGTYPVELIACNSNGCDTAVQLINVTVSGGPIAASCTPATTSYCCGMGIYNVTFNTINYTTNDGADGYQDYTCVVSTNVTSGQTYAISVETGSGLNENVKAWIDWNNDGNFDTSEVVLDSPNQLINHSGTVSVPLTAITDTALRMRVGSDWFSYAVDACTDVTYGQFEDYSVIVLPPPTFPTAAFTSNLPSSCQGTVVFTDVSANNPTSWQWNFGDANSDTVQNPVHIYADTGMYTVQLIACNSYGCDTFVQSVVITDVSGSVAVACIPQTTGYCCGMGVSNVTFNTINNTTADGSDGYQDYTCTMSTVVTAGQVYALNVTTGASINENTRAWIDWNNDGNFDTTEMVLESLNQLTNHSANVIIPSNAVQNMQLRLRVGSDYFAEPTPEPCVDVVYGQFEDYAVTVLPDTVPTIAGFSWAFSDICNGIVQFIDTSYNGPTSWQWDFGDGNTDTIQNPLHTYSASGTYTVQLIACNAYGCDTATTSLTIIFITAGFNVSGYMVKDSLITFTDNSTGIPVSWSWDFGDGNTSVVQSPTHVYADTGTYTVVLIVSDSAGCSDTANMTLTILPFTGPPISSFNASPAGCDGTVQFTDFSTNVPDSWQWDFGDGNSDTLQNPAHTYLLSGTYTVQLIACNPYGCDTATMSVTVSLLSAGFNVTGDLVKDSLLTFTDNSSGAVASWSWDFGDSSLSNSLQNPTHAFADSGTYTVTLIVTDSAGCNDTATTTLTILLFNTPPSAAFSDSLTGNCDGMVQFTDLSTSNPNSWQWNFGDGNSDTVQNPVNIYIAAGNYIVQLIACNAYGCDTTVQTVSITGVGGPVPASCLPVTTAFCCGIGIYNVSFNTINNTTGDGSDGYQDYSCTQSTDVVAGQSYILSIQTNNSINEDVKAWMDWNNDGIFDSSEVILTSDNTLMMHSGTVTVPTSAVFNTPLRMRIGSDYFTQPSPQSC